MKRRQARFCQVPEAREGFERMDRKGLHVYFEQREISLNAGTWGEKETWTQNILGLSLASTTDTLLTKESMITKEQI